MNAAALTALAIAAGAIISPGQVLLTLLLLSAPRGRSKAVAYYLGYTSSYAAIGITSVLVSAEIQERDTTAAPENADSSTTMIFFVVVGTLLLLLALRTARARSTEPKPRPKFFEKLDALSRLKLFGLGIAVSVINAKNLTIYLSSMAFLVSAGLSPERGIAVALAAAFVVSLAIFGPIFVYAVGRKRAEPWLAALRERLEKNARVISLIVLTLIGASLLIRGIYGLAV